MANVIMTDSYDSDERIHDVPFHRVLVGYKSRELTADRLAFMKGTSDQESVPWQISDAEQC
ncbi:hypothetical protein BDN67DRAFT_976282 [Paxillus ammoniavirescens]|nr:hypothetical protein BDN67DRAFT_976282 [Paxillus ammoniavirescens]